MIDKLLELAMRTLKGRMHFPEQVGGEAKQTTEEVLSAFEAGYRASLRGSREEVDQAAKRWPWYRHDFFWEGSGLAVAAGHCARLSRGNPDRRRLTDRYRRMYYTGYGFWNGVARSLPIPALKIDAERWHDVEDFPYLGPLIAGGLAFAAVGMEKRFDPRTLAKLKVPDHPGWKEALVHGSGRALWFLYMHNPERVGEIIEPHPELQRGLLAGVGIAIAFTQLGTPERITRDVLRFPPAYHEGLLKGIGVTLAEITEDNPEVSPHIDAIADERLQGARRLAREVGQRFPRDVNWYLSFTKAYETAPLPIM